jgi:hypothetical protein
MMKPELLAKLNTLLHAWHEAGRESFEHRYKNLDYDSPGYAKSATERRKYIALDSGSSGAFLVDKNTGHIFTIKAYGVPKHWIGSIDELSGAQLFNWRPY